MILVTIDTSAGLGLRVASPAEAISKHVVHRPESPCHGVRSALVTAVPAWIARPRVDRSPHRTPVLEMGATGKERLVLRTLFTTLLAIPGWWLRGLWMAHAHRARRTVVVVPLSVMGPEREPLPAARHDLRVVRRRSTPRVA